jgi:hypothetical protein
LHADYSVNLKWAFLLGEDELKKLSRLLSERVGNVAYCAHCADDVARNFATIAEVMSYENSRQSQIKRFRIDACSDDRLKRATIDMSDSEYRGISLDFHGRDDVVDRLRADVLDILSGMRPWSGIFHRVNFLWASLGVICVMCFGFLVMIALNQIRTTKSSGDGRDAVVIARIYAAGLLFLLLGSLVNLIRNRLFPSAIFLIGQGKTRFQRLERFQWGFVIAFVVSFLAGLVVVVLQLVAA